MANARVKNLAQAKRIMHWVIRNVNNLPHECLTPLDWKWTPHGIITSEQNHVRFSVGEKVHDRNRGVAYSIKNFVVTSEMLKEALRLAEEETKHGVSARLMESVSKHSQVLANDLFSRLKDTASRDVFFAEIERQHTATLRLVSMLSRIVLRTQLTPDMVLHHYVLPAMRTCTAYEILGCSADFRRDLLLKKINIQSLHAVLVELVREHGSNRAVAEIIADYCTEIGAQ